LTCPFCAPNEKDVLVRNTHAYVRMDAYPVAQGHVLVIPFRHVANWFDVTPTEATAIFELSCEYRKRCDATNSPDGYTIGVNIGAAGGQTISHAHLHVIPRYVGDVVDPKGGVRGIISKKQHYPHMGGLDRISLAKLSPSH
jgi:diadenosine tetraphosphate (Ap4A) HIT family hydrolase